MNSTSFKISITCWTNLFSNSYLKDLSLRKHFFGTNLEDRAIDLAVSLVRFPQWKEFFIQESYPAIFENMKKNPSNEAYIQYFLKLFS
jgi:hypothetical protein